jgi:hypothetical protein
MPYVQTACTIAFLKVETISDCREKKTLSKKYIISVQHNIILHQLHSFSSNHCPFLQKNGTWIITFVHRKVSKLKEIHSLILQSSLKILASMYLGHQRLRPFCLLHDITQNLGVKYIHREHSNLHTFLFAYNFLNQFELRTIKTKPFMQILKLNGKSFLITC